MSSIYDVAEMAGVSATTVSRVVHNKSCSAKSSRKVRQAIEQLGYIPDARASALKHGINRSIGVIVPDIANPVYPVAVKAIHDCAKDRGYHMILGNTYGSVEEEIELLQLMARERVAGLIIATSEGEDDQCCDPYISALIGTGTKVVIAGRARGDLQADLANVDNEDGGYKANSYLLRIGRRRIAIVAGPRQLVGTEGRLAGYLRALKEYGIQPDERLMSFFGWTAESGRNQVQEMLERGAMPDAVFCCNDLLAVGAMEAIKEQHLSIPDDIAVVGFDNIDIASMVTPKLTTVAQPQARLAAMTCSLLLDRVENRVVGEPKELRLKPELVIRESA